MCVCAGWRLGVPQSSLESSLTLEAVGGHCSDQGRGIGRQGHEEGERDRNRQRERQMRLSVCQNKRCQRLPVENGQTHSLVRWDWSYTGMFYIPGFRHIPGFDDRMGLFFLIINPNNSYCHSNYLLVCTMYSATFGHNCFAQLTVKYIYILYILYINQPEHYDHTMMRWSSQDNGTCQALGNIEFIGEEQLTIV